MAKRQRNPRSDRHDEIGFQQKATPLNNEIPRAVAVPPEPRLLTPTKNELWTPPSPFNRRMAGFSRMMGPLMGRMSPQQVRQIEQAMATDIAFNRRLEDLKRLLPSWIRSRMIGGSGLQMCDLLRHYFLEYAGRLLKHGVDAFPSSFNVVESFLKFDTQHFLFDIRPEREHLLVADDFFEWYGQQPKPFEPAVALEALDEGVVFSFDMSGGPTGYRIIGEGRSFLVAGVSFVRHARELSCILLAGEQPPGVPDDFATTAVSFINLEPSRKGLVPAPDLELRDRYLTTFPDFARVILMTRLDLKSHSHEIRYANTDLGKGYQVLTNDRSVVEDLPEERIEAILAQSKVALRQYDPAFKLLGSLIALPIFFLDKAKEVSTQRFPTEIKCTKNEAQTRELINKVGYSECVMWRDVKCMPSAGKHPPGKLNIETPELSFEAGGFWKQIPPGHVGNDKDGNSIFGRTWVHQTNSWAANEPSAILLQQGNPWPDGPDPGVIYVVRSPAHGLEIYKVGLTRRTAELRTAELNTTGVPLPFGILATWHVGDCVTVEAEVHKRLAARRVASKREFFRAPLAEIIAAVESVLAEKLPLRRRG